MTSEPEKCFQQNYINSPSDRTIDKCPQKCGSCSLDSVNKDQCISCNNVGNYYSKEVDETNISPYKQCYHTDAMQIGFYLDTITNTFKACYERCKTCNGAGDEDNNNCSNL